MTKVQDTGNPAAGGPGVRRRMKAERPQQILEAAFEEFAARGFAAARLDDIARRVGVTKGTIYLYFPSKVELFKAVVRTFTQPLLEEVEAAIEGHTGSKAKLLREQILQSYCETLDDTRERELMRLLIAEGEKFPELTEFYHDEVMVPFERMSRAIIEAGIATGEFRDSALKEVPLMLFSPLVLHSVWALLFGDRHPIADKTFIAAHLDLILNGVLQKPQDSDAAAPERAPAEA